VTQTAESRQVNVSQADFLEFPRQRRLVELRIVSRARHRPHIDYARHTVRPQQVNEFIERACGMPNSQDDRRRLCRKRRIFLRTGSLVLTFIALLLDCAGRGWIVSSA
jgi:hypothetical protein